MCFVLYAGTSKPIPRKQWNADAPDINVTDLTERESPIRSHFSTPEVQCIGSTSQCGCDFPHVVFQNGDWPWFDDDEPNPEAEARDQRNREGLVTLMRSTGENKVELYGVWDGDFDFNTPPAVREEIRLGAILSRDFRFKEQVFYVVHL